MLAVAVSAWPRARARLVVFGLGLCVLLPGLAQVAQAGHASASLLVSVKLVASPAKVFCTSQSGTGNFGAAVTVVCSTGAVVGIAVPERTAGLPAHGGAFEYLIPMPRGGKNFITVDTQAISGTVTGWQVVRFADRDYVELTLGW
jgi:hypothetical protein